MNDRISVIIPSRNRLKLLTNRALLALFFQKYEPYEIIVVDDGSDIPYSVNEWLEERVKLIRIEKVYSYPPENKKAEWLSGPAIALNKALEHVTGNWIYRCDDDDWLFSDCLMELLKFAKKGNFDFVSALWRKEDGTIGMPYESGTVIPELGVPLGGVQTWLCRAEYKEVKYNPYSWKKKWNANNELDWLERVVEKFAPKVGFLPKVVCEIDPRPGLEEIGLKAYLKEHGGKK